MSENIIKKSEKVRNTSRKIKKCQEWKQERKKKIKLDRKYSECPTAEKEIKRNDEMGWNTEKERKSENAKERKEERKKERKKERRKDREREKKKGIEIGRK